MMRCGSCLVWAEGTAASGHPSGRARRRHLDRSLELVHELECLTSHMVGQTRLDDALDPRRLDVPHGRGLEVEHGLRCTHHGIRVGVLPERTRDRAGLCREGRYRAGDAVALELAEDLGSLECLLDEGVLVGIKQMGYAYGVFIHDVRPEGHDLLALALDRTPSEGIEAALPALGLVARVIEEQRPDQAP